MNFCIKLMLLIGTVIFQGCGSSSSIGSKSDVMITTNSSDTSLTTLSLDAQSIGQTLESKTWKTVTANIANFYENSNLPILSQDYTVEILFSDHTVLAYADCQKLTAKYKINENEITFSNATIVPAVELATCIESRYADDATLAFFENSFLVESLSTDEIVFQAVDFDTEVILKR